MHVRKTRLIKEIQTSRIPLTDKVTSCYEIKLLEWFENIAKLRLKGG